MVGGLGGEAGGSVLNWMRSSTAIAVGSSSYRNLHCVYFLPRSSSHFPAGDTQITSQLIDTALATFGFNKKDA